MVPIEGGGGVELDAVGVGISLHSDSRAGGKGHFFATLSSIVRTGGKLGG